MKKLFVFLVIFILFLNTSFSGTTYEPGGGSPPDPADYVTCDGCGVSCDIEGYYMYESTEIDTVTQEPGQTVNCAADKRCCSDDVDKTVQVTISAGSQYTYSVAHWWSNTVSVEVAADLLGISSTCGGQNSESFTCTSLVGTQTPVTVHIDASTWDDPKTNWTIYRTEITIAESFIAPEEEPTCHTYTPYWFEGGHKARSLMETAVSNVIASNCKDGIESGPNCPPCGTEGSPSGPCTGADCPNILCSHH